MVVQDNLEPPGLSALSKEALQTQLCRLQTIVQGIEATEIIPGRCEVIDEDQPFGCVVDAADTPGALSRLMDGLQECKPKRLILVLGCPGEAQEEKRPFMGEIAHYKVRPPLHTPLQLFVLQTSYGFSGWAAGDSGHHEGSRVLSSLFLRTLRWCAADQPRPAVMVAPQSFRSQYTAIYALPNCRLTPWP